MIKEIKAYKNSSGILYETAAEAIKSERIRRLEKFLEENVYLDRRGRICCYSAASTIVDHLHDEITDCLEIKVSN